MKQYERIAVPLSYGAVTLTERSMNPASPIPVLCILLPAEVEEGHYMIPANSIYLTDRDVRTVYELLDNYYANPASS